jgi:hypothetical protein
MWRVLAIDQNLVLASFQERSLLRLLSNTSDTGTIVTAGTGSGKTLAFYLPTFLRVADNISINSYWVKVLAIYPRTELLKDQLSEAFRRSRLLDYEMNSNGKRPILLGAYFSSTPNRVDARAIEEKKWKKYSGGYICPWFNCPSCESELGWINSDIADKKERLVCTSKQCNLVIGNNQLILTRDRLATHLPDILFTTTEMLNQRMSDLRMKRLFGIGQPQNQKPLFALLDEVHTYVGTSGAQVALLLRRWRKLVDSPVTWCGLSATLREASRFFSDLTGVAADRVAEISPTSDEIVSEGVEYQIILRGDPTLQTGVLSTSIQSAMLISRMMDPEFGNPSKGYFGSRLFVFADDLDVTNRLFDNLRDAEAYTIFGKPNPSKAPLAFLRGDSPEDPRRDPDGQRWWASERIGRKLDERLIVGRTTSKDAGVLSNADVIVATSALEVGYNDDHVGSVLQHKSPRNMASFLQRKGRAGRKRGTRPMTVVTLSDYGRDRASFQAYEHLFDPSLPPQYLPIQNQYVLRMQAVYAFIDWLGEECSDLKVNGWLWDILSKPNDTFSQPVLNDKIKQKLTALNRGDQSTISSLSFHLIDSLKISKETVDSILWDPPRPLLLEVVPTLTRRFIVGWQLAYPLNGVSLDFQVDYHPLPDFIPRNLFSDLSLPEVQLMLPPATVKDDWKKDSLPIIQALQQLAPGRVTRRFADERGGLSHWFEINPSELNQSLAIQNYAEHNELIGTFEGRRDNGETCSIPVYRPWGIRLNKTPKDILPSSNAFPIWYSGFVTNGTPLVIGVPARSLWFEHVSDIHFYLHRFRSNIATRRFSPEVTANVRKTSGESLISISYVNQNNLPAAVGFEIEVDGFYVDFKVPKATELITLPLSNELNSSCRQAYIRYRLLSDAELAPELNTLYRDWIYQILISASISRATLDNTSLGEAATTILAESPGRTFSDVMKTLFLMQNGEYEEDTSKNSEEFEENSDDTKKISRLEERLNETFSKKEVIDRLRILVQEIDNPDQEVYADWIRHTLYETLSEALLQACINTAPRHAATDTLVSDFEINNETGSGRVWITETTIGGAGVVQAFADAFSAEPRALFRALEAALSPTDMELSEHGLKRFLILMCEVEEVRESIAAIRKTSDHVERDIMRSDLYEKLGHKGLDVSHALSVSINTRILRPGSSPDWDILLLDLVLEWERLEEHFSLSIGVREFCYVALQIPDLRIRVVKLALLINSHTSTDSELIQILSSVLWPRGIEVRQKVLQSYNPFRARRLTDPALVRKLLLEAHVPEINIESIGWSEEFEISMTGSGTVQLVAQSTNSELIRKAIIKVISKPINVGFLQFFPIVERIERSEIHTRVTLSLREQV